MHTTIRTRANMEKRISQRTLFRLFLERLLQNRLSMLGVIIIMLALTVAIGADLLSPYDPNQQDIVKSRLQPPSREHLFGTDQYGRDVLSRVIHGTRISLMVGISSIAMATVLGVLLGGISGFSGGRVDDIIMRIMDIFLAFPALILGIGIMAVLGPSIGNVIAVITVVSTPQIARVTRSAVLAQKEEEYMQAAQAIGVPTSQLFFKHLLLNCLPPIIVQSTLLVASAILTETALSFLGIGVRPPTPTWGSILFEGKDYILLGMWWMSVFPGIAIMITMLGINFLGDGLRDALDPRLSHQ